MKKFPSPQDLLSWSLILQQSYKVQNNGDYNWSYFRDEETEVPNCLWTWPKTEIQTLNLKVQTLFIKEVTSTE
jgi:hypothetical protein